jgi:hypothetical protein
MKELLIYLLLLGILFGVACWGLSPDTKPVMGYNTTMIEVLK